jgi:hypothetical protein
MAAHAQTANALQTNRLLSCRTERHEGRPIARKAL